MTRRLTALAAAVVCLVMFCAAAGAETTARETYSGSKLSRINWEDENGEAAAGPDGYAEVRYTYQGQDRTERYFDADGNPYTVRGGYAGKTVTTDGKGQVTSVIYLDGKGDKTLNALGYNRVRMTYTSFGGVRFVGYYGTGKSAVTVPSLGYATVTTEFSGKEATSRTWADASGNPVDNAQGYAVMRQKLNSKHQVIRTRFEHADGTPALCEDGWSLRVIDRDGKGRITAVSWYDTAEKPTDRGLGYVREETEYGDDFELVTRRAADGSLVPWYGDAVVLKRKVKDGRVVSETWMNAQRDPAEGPAGVSTTVYGYDITGRLETVRYQNAAGESALCAGGYAGYRESRDADGAVTGRTFLGVDGLPVMTIDGYSEIRYQYDEMKQVTATRYYDLNGNQVTGR